MAQTTATAVTTTGVLTVTSVSGITVGQAVQLTGTMFGGLNINTTYYVIGVGTSTVSLSATPGGGVLSISAGSGKLTVSTGVTATSVTSGGVLTVGSVTGITIGRTVKLFGTPFGGLITTTNYFVIAVGASTITLSLTQGGAAVPLVGGSGNMVAQIGPAIGPGLGSIVTSGSTTLTDPKYGDYNTIQALVAKVLGAPTDADPRYGYNQTVSSSPVAFGNKINLSQWLNLRNDMVKARGHQTGSASESNNITLPTSSSKVTEAIRSEYLTYAQTLTTYRDTLGTGQFTPVTANTCFRNSAWNGNLQSIITVNIGDKANARGFFNAGGQVKFTVSMAGTFSAASTFKDDTWKQMFGSMGTITFDRTATTIDSGSTGTTYAIGYFGLTTTDQLIFQKQAPTGNYTPNLFQIYARLNSTNAGIIIFSIYYKDLDVGLLNADGSARANTGFQTDEYIDGEITQTTGIILPTGSYVTFLATQPVVTQAGDFQNTSGAVYGLLASSYKVDEGSTVTVTLKTLNVADGTFVPYSVTGTGISASRFSSGGTSGNFQVFSGQATASWTIANNLFTDGPTTMTVQLNNGLAVVNIDINDTSKTPTGSQLFNSVVTNASWVAPPGVRTITALIVGGGGGGGNFAGGGGGAGQLRYFTTNTSPGQTYFVTVGAGGARNAQGQQSSFNNNPAFGGQPGTAGSTTGHGGTHTGGNGGANGSNTFAGGTGSSSSGTTNLIAGGGGAGSTQGGANGSGSTNTGGAGGNGTMLSFYGNNTIFICGGGGGGAGKLGGAATYGGGNGDSGNGIGDNGIAATGGGGGGGGANYEGTQTGGGLVGYNGGQGGSGLVWIGWP